MLFTYAVKAQAGQGEKSTPSSLNSAVWHEEGWEFSDDSWELSQYSPYHRNDAKTFWPVGKGKDDPLGNLWQHYKMKMFAIYIWLGTVKGFFGSKFYIFFILPVNGKADRANCFLDVHIEKQEFNSLLDTPFLKINKDISHYLKVFWAGRSLSLSFPAFPAEELMDLSCFTQHICHLPFPRTCSKIYWNPYKIFRLDPQLLNKYQLNIFLLFKIMTCFLSQAVVAFRSLVIF